MLRKIALIGLFAIVVFGKHEQTHAQVAVFDLDSLIAAGRRHADQMDWMADETGDPYLRQQAEAMGEFWKKARAISDAAKRFYRMAQYVEDQNVMGALSQMTWGLYSLERAGVEHEMDRELMEDVHRVLRRSGLGRVLDDHARREAREEYEEARRRRRAAQNGEQGSGVYPEADADRLAEARRLREGLLYMDARELALLREQTEARRQYIAELERQMANVATEEDPDGAAAAIGMNQAQLALAQTEAQIERQQREDLERLEAEAVWEESVQIMEATRERAVRDAMIEWGLEIPEAGEPEEQ